MFKRFLLLLLLGHIVGDYYVQTQKVANKKQNSKKWVIFHGGYYFIAMCMISLPVMSVEVFVMDVVASLLHMMIDLGKYWYTKKLSDVQKRCNEKNIYLVDQMLHLACIVGISCYMTMQNILLSEWKIFKSLMDMIGLSEIVVVSWLITILLLHKPANILIQKLLKFYKPQEKENEIKRDNNAGRFIGTMERVVMLIFISLGQYSAVGLVLTAKSIARYDRISQDKEFAEYYLLGTLLSTLIVVVCFLVIRFFGAYH